MQKRSATKEEEMRQIREEIDRNEERFRQLSDKADKNKMADAAMAAELQSLQAEKKEEAAMPRKQVTAVWRKCYTGLSHWERMEWRSCSKESEEKWEWQGQMPGREEGRRRNGEDERQDQSAVGATRARRDQ